MTPSAFAGAVRIRTADLAFIYLLTENVQVDCAGNIGVRDAADDINVFSGISIRF
jgi:hypothetical protein